MESPKVYPTQLDTGAAIEMAEALFVRQVKDKSLPAVKILEEQQQGLDSTQPPRVFVP